MRLTRTLDRAALHSRAAAFSRNNGRPQAIEAYEELLRRDGNDRIAIRCLAALYYSKKDYARARPLACQLLRYRETAEIGHAFLGTFYAEEKVVDKAVACYEKVLELDPSLAALPYPASIFWDEMTESLIELGRADDARRLLIDALTRSDDAFLHLRRARIEKQMGNLDDAEACSRRALERDATLHEAWLIIGQILLQRDRPDQAVAYLERARELKADDLATVYSLEQAYQQLGRTGEARRLAETAKKLRAHAEHAAMTGAASR